MTPDVDLVVACLRAYREHRDRLPHGTLIFQQVSEIMALISASEVVELLREDPVRSALRGRVRDVGWRVSQAEGGIAAMAALMVKVENAMPDCATWAGSTLDRWWAGIGRPHQWCP